MYPRELRVLGLIKFRIKAIGAFEEFQIQTLFASHSKRQDLVSKYPDPVN